MRMETLIGTNQRGQRMENRAKHDDIEGGHEKKEGEIKRRGGRENGGTKQSLNQELLPSKQKADLE